MLSTVLNKPSPIPGKLILIYPMKWIVLNPADIARSEIIFWLLQV